MRSGGYLKHTNESDARIREGYAAGERVSSIAAALGATRNVVIGRAFRLGLSVAGRQNASIYIGRPPHHGVRAREYKNRETNHSTAFRVEPAI